MQMIRNIYLKLRKKYIRRRTFFRFIKKGVIHVGAHVGQERGLYRHLNLNVLWVEAIPEVHRMLEQNIKSISNQSSINALIAEEEGREYLFHVARQTSRSSLYNFTNHHYADKAFKVSHDIRLISTTIKKLLEKKDISPNMYDCLVTDCQGADLMAIKSAGSFIKDINFVVAEVMVKPCYEGQPLEKEVNEYLFQQGFRLISDLSYSCKSSQRDNFYVRESLLRKNLVLRWSLAIDRLLHNC